MPPNPLIFKNLQCALGPASTAPLLITLLLLALTGRGNLLQISGHADSGPPETEVWARGLELAYLAMLAGAASQLAGLTATRTIRQPLPRIVRSRVEVVAVTLAALLTAALVVGMSQFVATAPGHAAAVGLEWAPWGPAPRPVGLLLGWALFAALLHLGAIGTLLLRTSWTPATTVLAYLAATWLVPGLVSSRALQLLDPSIHLVHWREGVTKVVLLADMMPVAALLLSAGLMPYATPRS